MSLPLRFIIIVTLLFTWICAVKSTKQQASIFDLDLDLEKCEGKPWCYLSFTPLLQTQSETIQQPEVESGSDVDLDLENTRGEEAKTQEGKDGGGGGGGGEEEEEQYIPITQEVYLYTAGAFEGIRVYVFGGLLGLVVRLLAERIYNKVYNRGGDRKPGVIMNESEEITVARGGYETMPVYHFAKTESGEEGCLIRN